MDQLIFNRAATAIVQSQQQVLKAKEGVQLALDILLEHGANDNGRKELTERLEAYLLQLETMERTAQEVWKEA